MRGYPLTEFLASDNQFEMEMLEDVFCHVWEETPC